MNIASTRFGWLLDDHANARDCQYGDLQWNYTTGLDTNGVELGQVAKTGSRYAIVLDEAGTGFVANTKLIAHWRFDESSGTTAYDSAGMNDGALKGSEGVAAHTTGKFGRALDLDYTNQEHVEIGSDNFVTNLSGEKTFAFWTRLRTRPGSNNASGFIGIDTNTSDNRWYIDDNNMSGGIRTGGSGMTGSFTVGNGALNYDQDVWQHVVVTDDGSGTDRATRIYIDGQLVGSRASFDYSGLPETSVLRLGAARHGGGYQYLHGGLDDFGIWNAALTELQVKTLYNLGSHSDINHDLGQVQRLFDAYDAGGGTVRNGSLEWKYTTGIQTEGAEVGEPFKANGRYIIALDDAGAGFVANAELIAHWRFDETSGTTAYDSAGTNDGTLQGAGSTAAHITGKFGGALGFDSSASQFVNIGNNNVITALSGAKTLSFWTRLKTDSTSNGFITIDNGTSANRWYLDDQNSGGSLRAWQVGGGHDGEVFTATDVFNYDSTQWQHVLIADDGSGTDGVRVYVNGQLVHTGDSFDYSGLAAGSVLQLGVARHPDVYHYLNGDLDDFGVWRVALSDSQAKMVYNAAQIPNWHTIWARCSNCSTCTRLAPAARRLC